MASFAPPPNKFLNPPLAPSRKKSQRFLPTNDDIDEFLSSDLEVSFASNVSLNSPPRDPISLASDCAMDISPAPAPKTQSMLLSSGQRPRSYTSNGRLFGNDLSNSHNPLLPSAQLVSGQTAKVVGATQSSSRKTQRAALPLEWLAPARNVQPAQEPPSPMDDAMDVDTSFSVDQGATDILLSPEASPAPAPQSSPGFQETMSPARRSFESPVGPQHKKRRSLSPDSARAPRHHNHDLSSSPMLPSSPSDSKLERMNNAAAASRLGKPGLAGLGAAPTAGFVKRRRPVLSAMVQSYDREVVSAYPILSPPASGHEHVEDNSPRGAAPARRAFSAFLPPSIYTEPEEEDTSFDGNDMSSPAQAYSKRQQVKTIRRCDGTEDFRPLTGATALVQKDSPSAKFMAAGLPGFGDNEAHGKILPCHRVTEDGLMRINHQTLDDLLDGKFDDRILDYHIIDCRFDYEYNGGHIPGAVNMNTTTAVEELLLGPSLTKPKPSVSGDNNRKTILVFHCEFSAKRAPTFAKHLRAKDRAMNNHLYPKIHYPEVYILEGGYCAYFKASGHRCEPPAYVTMDDPNHASARREDLDQFRKAKFGRHKSYAYGDSTKTLVYGNKEASKRNTAPSAPPSLFAAATAARSRRGNTAQGLMTLAEDGNVTADETDTDLGDSPCPPPVKASTFKLKKLPRIAGLTRSETYGPGKLAY
ncbi:hypothetical protein CPC08DRAFT_113169 [Agrocybe pediades]|nr:hypothetical protein CPC08DRAFT_113169 [Agrocybe pediades]